MASTNVIPWPIATHLARLDAGRMDIHKMLAEMRAHAAALDDLIQAAERYESVRTVWRPQIRPGHRSRATLPREF